MTIISCIIFLVTLAAILWILSPLFQGEHSIPVGSINAPHPTLDGALRRQQQLDDLVADQELGKLDSDDFLRLKRELDAN